MEFGGELVGGLWMGDGMQAPRLRFFEQELSGIGQELTEIFFLTAITSNGPAITSNALASERYNLQDLQDFARFASRRF